MWWGPNRLGGDKCDGDLDRLGRDGLGRDRPGRDGFGGDPDRPGRDGKKRVRFVEVRKGGWEGCLRLCKHHSSSLPPTRYESYEGPVMHMHHASWVYVERYAKNRTKKIGKNKETKYSCS